MWPYPWTHVGTPSHVGHMDRVAATMPSQAHAGAAQEAPDIGQWEGQDVPLVRPSSCKVKGGIPSSRRYLPTYLRRTGRWSQRRTRSTFLLQGPGGVATRLVRRIGGPAVHGDSEQHAGYGHHHLRWGKAQEGQGKRRNGSSGANGNGTIAIRAAKGGSSDPRGATGVQ